MTAASSLNPGDIVFADLDPIVGFEIGGKRPCVVISAPHKSRLTGDSLETVIVVPVTSTRRTWWTVVEINDRRVLPEISYALCHNIRGISIKRISNHYNSLDDKTFTKIKAVLRDILGL